jgi:hypothetical protein
MSLQSIADEQVLYLTTIGRTTGLPREIEIWFVLCRERFYLLAETGEAAGWVKNIRRNPKVKLCTQNGKLTRWRVCWTVKAIANCGTKWLQSPIANMDGATGCRWRSRRFPHAACDNFEFSVRLRGSR